MDLIQFHCVCFVQRRPSNVIWSSLCSPTLSTTLPLVNFPSHHTKSPRYWSTKKILDVYILQIILAKLFATGAVKSWFIYNSAQKRNLRWLETWEMDKTRRQVDGVQCPLVIHANFRRRATNPTNRLRASSAEDKKPGNLIFAHWAWSSKPTASKRQIPNRMKTLSQTRSPFLLFAFRWYFQIWFT